MQDATRPPITDRSRLLKPRFLVPTLLVAAVVVESALVRVSAGPLRNRTEKVARSADSNTSLGAQATGNELAKAIELAKASQEAAYALKDYSATFSKQERIRNRLSQQVMNVKVRHEPFGVYLKFQQPHAGREVIYSKGQNNGNFLVHEEGLRALAGTFAFAPNSPEAMNENHYPITMIGIGKMAELVVAQWEAEQKHGEVDVKFYPNAKIGNLECQMIESTHPQARQHFRYHKTRLYIDKQTNLPVRVEQYAFPRSAREAPPLFEEYTFSNLRTNIGLTGADFDPRNPNYRF